MVGDWESWRDAGKISIEYTKEAFLDMTDRLGDMWLDLMGLFGHTSRGFFDDLKQIFMWISDIFIFWVIDIPIKAFNKMAQTIVKTANFIIDQLNKIPGVKLVKVEFEPLKSDYITQDFIEGAERLYKEWKPYIDKIGRAFVSAWEGIKSGAKTAFEFMGEVADKWVENLKKGFKLIGAPINGALFKSEADKAKDKGTAPARPSTFLEDINASAIATPTDQEGENDAVYIPTPGEKEKTAWDEWAEHIGTVMDTVKEAGFSLYDSLSSGMGQAVSSMILEGKNFGESMKAVFKDMVGVIIQALIKMALQWIASSIIAQGASHAQAMTIVANHAVEAGAGAGASQAGIPIIGPILAVVAMGAMIATIMALQGKLKMASGGIATGPVNALIGESGPEAVIPLDKLGNLVGNRSQTIIIDLDGREIARSVILHAPREIRLNTGVTM
jgi:hypothetical protein